MADGGRRLQLNDLMILVVGAALAFGMIRAFTAGTIQQLPIWDRVLAVVLGGLMAATPTLLLLRLRRPRPPLRRLACEPGFAASLAGTAILSLGLSAIGIIALIQVVKRAKAALGSSGVSGPDQDWWLDVILQFSVMIGPAVVAAWLLLAVSGRRRPRRGWLDPLGRLVGTLWIIVFVVNAIARLASSI